MTRKLPTKVQNCLPQNKHHPNLRHVIPKTLKTNIGHIADKESQSAKKKKGAKKQAFAYLLYVNIRPPSKQANKVRSAYGEQGKRSVSRDTLHQNYTRANMTLSQSEETQQQQKKLQQQHSGIRNLRTKKQQSVIYCLPCILSIHFK